MSDSLERLYQAVIAAKDLDPAVSRTAKLFQHGPAKMAKKLAEEAIEVVIDAVNGKPDAVVRESADLLYNLTVLWASAGIQPDDVWREMQRREQMLGIAEKLPKSAAKAARAAPTKAAPDRIAPAEVVAREGATVQIAASEGAALQTRIVRTRHVPGFPATNCRVGRSCAAQAPLACRGFPAVLAWTNPSGDGSSQPC